MICPNPICKSIIPDDSKFCPDCGTAIKNIASLRTEAKDIVDKFPKGYKALVDSGILPPVSEYLSAEGYELIIKKKSDIVQKHTELIRDETKQISISYPKGYEYCVSTNNIPQYSEMLSIDGYNKIISNRELIIQQENRLVAEEKSRELKESMQKKLESTEFLRDEARKIVQKYSVAYESFVKCGIFPHFSESLPLEAYEDITKKKWMIVKKYNEIFNNSLIISTSQLNFDNSGKCCDIAKINCSHNCTITVDSEWIHFVDYQEQGHVRTVTKMNMKFGKIPIHVDKNTESRRSGNVIISNDYGKKTIKIVQEGWYSTNSGCLGLLITLFLSLNGGLLFIVWVLSNAL